jgi:hypothetical protein
MGGEERKIQVNASVYSYGTHSTILEIIAKTRAAILAAALLLSDVTSKAECWTNGQTQAVTSFIQQIVKEVYVNKVSGKAYAKVFCGIYIKAAANAVKRL